MRDRRSLWAQHHGTAVADADAERRTPNAERRTPNAERRTPNAERRTPTIRTPADREPARAARPT
ncbi:hypothetical protein DN526_08310 [Burkholderia multivorans]|nr:hypothetical protein DN526_08310 [Burkholderia multivorans]